LGLDPFIGPLRSRSTTTYAFDPIYAEGTVVQSLSTIQRFFFLKNKNKNKIK